MRLGCNHQVEAIEDAERAAIVDQLL